MTPRRLSFSSTASSASSSATDDSAASAVLPAPSARHTTPPADFTNLHRPGRAGAAAATGIGSRLTNWVDSGMPFSQRMRRQEAVSQIRTVIASRITTLDLSGQNLGTLPDCLYELRFLDNLNVSGNELVTLPRLPPRLTQLTASENSLVSLPALPPHLTHLSLSNNSLLSLPALPAALTHLDVSDNHLSALPAALPVGLTDLNAAFNRLDHVPMRLPQTLQTLLILDNQITQLPAELPLSLSTLWCYNNPLTTVPDSVFAMQTADANVRLSTSMLDGPARQRIRQHLQMRFSGEINGPEIHPIDMEVTPQCPIDSLPLAARWWTGSTEAECAIQGPKREAAWQSIQEATASDPEAMAQAVGFAEFLGKLAASEESTNPVLYRQLRVRTSAVLDRLEQDDTLRALCMNIGAEYSNTCGDAATTGFMAIELALIANDVEHGRKTAPQVIALGRQFMRLDALDAFAQTLGHSEHGEYLELNLWLRTNLAETLDLPVNGRAMLYADFSEQSFGVNQATLENATAHVEAATADRQKTIDFLVGWQPWHKRLELSYPAKFSSDVRMRALRRKDIDERMGKLDDAVNSMKSGEYLIQAEQLGSERKLFENTNKALLVELTEREFDKHCQ